MSGVRLLLAVIVYSTKYICLLLHSFRLSHVLLKEWTWRWKEAPSKYGFPHTQSWMSYQCWKRRLFKNNIDKPPDIVQFINTSPHKKKSSVKNKKTLNQHNTVFKEKVLSLEFQVMEVLYYLLEIAILLYFWSHEIKLSVNTRSAKPRNYEEVFKRCWKMREVFRPDRSKDKNYAYQQVIIQIQSKNIPEKYFKL